MTELEIKVNDGKIYFPKSVKQLYPNSDRIVLWFRKVSYSKLLKDLGLTKEEAKDLVPHSNEIVSVRTKKEFFTLLKQEIPATFQHSENRARRIESSIRIICADSRPYDFNQSFIKAPEAYSNSFCAGNFVLVISPDKTYAEIWDTDVWQNIKTYLIENKKATAKDFEKFKTLKPKLDKQPKEKVDTKAESREDIVKMLEKHGL